MLVTVLEANTQLPNMEFVIERLLHKEDKMKNKDLATSSEEA